MNDFIKITEEFLENDNDYKKCLVSNVRQTVERIFDNKNLDLIFALEDCESPIEQLLAIEMENIGIGLFNRFNSYINVVDIEKQVEIKCGKNKYRVDFQIPVIYKNQENKIFVIECDGYDFHQKTKKQVEYDNKRQRDLQEAGYEIIRFSGTEIWHNAYQCALEIKNIIASKCKYIKGD